MQELCYDCCYYWKEDGEQRECCHWVSRCPDDKAPCEYSKEDYVQDPEEEAW